MNSPSAQAISQIRTRLRLGVRKLLALSRRVRPMGSLCSKDQAKILLTLAYARPLSDKACEEQTKYRTKSVLLYALSSAEHLRTIVPDFVNDGGANTLAETLSFEKSGVTMAANVLLADESKADVDNQKWSWARAYEEFWACIFESRSHSHLVKLLGVGAGPAMFELRAAISACLEIDQLVASDRLGEAFVTARRHVEGGLGAAASRYAALAFIHASNAFDIDEVLSQLTGKLPPGFVLKLQTLLQDKSGLGPPDRTCNSITPLGAYLPPVYTRLMVAGTGSIGDAVRKMSIWALLSRDKLSNPKAGQRAANIVDLSNEQAGEQSQQDFERGVRSRDVHRLRTSVQSLPRDLDPQAVLVLLSDRVDVPSEALPLLSSFLEQNEIVPIFVHTISHRAVTHWQAGDWTLDASFAGFVCGSVQHARELDGPLDREFLERLVADTHEPLILYRAAVPEGDEAQPELDALVVSADYATGKHHLAIAPDAVCEDVLMLLDDLAAKEGLDDSYPVIVTSPHLVYPTGYVEFIAQAHERGGRRASIAVCEVFVDKDTRIRVRLIDTNTPIVRTSLIALGCMALVDMRRSLKLQHGSRFYDALAVPSLPAVPVRHRIDMVGSNEAVLARLERRLENSKTAELVQHRSRLPLVAWITGSGSQLVPVVRGYNVAAKRYWAAQATISRFVQDPIDKQLAADTHHGVTSGWLDLLFDEHREQLLEDFLRKAMSDRAFLQECSLEVFMRIADMARRLGAQARYAELLLPHVVTLSVTSPHLTIEVFNFLVGAVDEAHFYALLIVAASAIFNRRDGGERSAYRLIEVASRYCDPRMMGLFLETVARSRKAHVIQEPEVCRKLGASLQFTEDVAEILMGLGISVADLRNAVPVRDRIAMTLVTGAERAEILSLLCRFTEENGDLIELAELIRPYSREFAALSINSSEWPYFFHGTADAVLAIAAILGDKVQIARSLPLAGNAELIAMARARSGDQAALDDYYRSLAEPLGVTALRFNGNSIVELFAQMAEQPSQRVAESINAKVSVIMTAWNPDIALLRLAVQSVINQTHQEFELFLVDDGSKPAIGKKIAEEASIDSRIHLIRLERNVGPYVGRNLALQQASGEFIAIQDADDFSHPDRFTIQLEQFAAHDSLMACASRHLRFDLNGQLQLEHDFQLRGDGTMSSMFRKTAFDLTGPFTPVRSRGDVEFRERIKKAFGTLGYRQLACPLVFCFSAPSTLSHSTRRDKSQQLQVFRNAFRAREWRATPNGPKPLGDLAIPWALRP